jgi:hypothetical protein
MENTDWLSKFMVGKKKYSASIVIPIIIAIINMLAVMGIVKPDQVSGIEGLIQEFFPTLIALFGGIAYTVVEGINDNTRAKNGTVAAVVSTSVSPAVPTVSQPAQAQPQVEKTETPIPFDKEAFMNMVEENVVKDFGVRNACTLYYEARRILREFWTLHNKEAMRNCWSFMATLVSNAFQEVWLQSFDDALIHLNDKPNCTYPNLEFKAIQEGMAHYAILQEYKEVQEIIESI